VAPEVLLICALVLALSASLTEVVRRSSWVYGLLDVPNERSSHIATTPRGGGVSIVIAATTGLLCLRWLNALRTDVLLALIGGGTAVAIVGFLDDRHRVAAGVRLTVHVCAALWALMCLGGLPPLAIGHSVVNLGWAGHGLALLGIVWTLNLFNFMDGIDGIAASEAVFIVCSGALLSLIHGQSAEILVLGLTFGAAALGFLLWNWPPATIFMGDVGSGYLGYVISVMAVAAARDNPAAVWIWLTLGGVFFIDATVTLLRRAIRRERLHEAHRCHAYQRLARQWGSHRRVTITVMLLNLGLLLPCALMAALYPVAALWVAIAALVSLVPVAVAAGLGRREGSS
jgi:Fuc2NAc and GlcNAc transferase